MRRRRKTLEEDFLTGEVTEIIEPESPHRKRGQQNQRKGKRGEYTIRDALRELGFKCDRRVLSGALDQGEDLDLWLYGDPIQVSVKTSARFAIQRWLARRAAKLLILNPYRAEPIVCQPLSEWAAMARAAEREP